MILRQSSFDRAFAKLNRQQQDAVSAIIDKIPSAFGHPHHHGGIGIRPFGNFFECRAGLGLRVIFLVDGEVILLLTVGNHDLVRAFLKNAR